MTKINEAPNSPLTRFDMESFPCDVHARPDGRYEARGTKTRVLFEGIAPINDLLPAIIDFCADRMGIAEDGIPQVTKVIFSGPATIVLFGDGDKMVTKLREGDEFDPLFGVMACLAKKLTGNRGHVVDLFEDMLKDVASGIQSVEDLEGLIAHGAFVQDMLEMLYDCRDKWLPMLGKPDDEPCREDGACPSAADEQLTGDQVDAIKDCIQKVDLSPEMLAQEIRRLAQEDGFFDGCGQ